MSGHLKAVEKLTYDYQQDKLISVSDDPELRVWDIEKQSCIKSVKPEHKGGIWDMTINQETS